MPPPVVLCSSCVCLLSAGGCRCLACVRGAGWLPVPPKVTAVVQDIAYWWLNGTPLAPCYIEGLPKDGNLSSPPRI